MTILAFFAHPDEETVPLESVQCVSPSLPLGETSADPFAALPPSSGLARDNPHLFPSDSHGAH